MTTLFDKVSETMKPIERLVRIAYDEGKRSVLKNLSPSTDFDCDCGPDGACPVHVAMNDAEGLYWNGAYWKNDELRKFANEQR